MTEVKPAGPFWKLSLTKTILIAIPMGIRYFIRLNWTLRGEPKFMRPCAGMR